MTSETVAPKEEETAIQPPANPQDVVWTQTGPELPPEPTTIIAQPQALEKIVTPEKNRSH